MACKQGLCTVVHHPSSLRNRDPIASELDKILSVHANSGEYALEIGSGTGAHLEVFAPKFPKLIWQPTEYIEYKDDKSQLERLDYVLKGMSNVRAALELDASLEWELWPVEVRRNEKNYALVYISNVFHISPWKVTLGVLHGAACALCDGGVLVTYGPYKIDGEFTTESNENFDSSLRQRNPEWGYRDITVITEHARKHGLCLKDKIDMPANNFLLVFQKQAAKSEPE